MITADAFHALTQSLAPSGTRLVAVSKFQPVEKIRALYDLGQRDFGENYAQELAEKAPQLPPDIRWHFIGHLQKNKVKYIAPFVHLIHSVDSYELLAEIQKRAASSPSFGGGEGGGRTIDVLLELKVAEEDTKHGLGETEIIRLLDQLDAQADGFGNIRVCGLMAMASFTSDEAQLSKEFTRAQTAFNHFKSTYFFLKPYFNTLSMGMSGDYQLAIAHGSTLVRIGTMLFGRRPASGDGQG